VTAQPLTKNGDGSYTISKGLVHILVGVVVSGAGVVAVSIISWWIGFAAFQSEMRGVAADVAVLQEWYRSGQPSLLAREKFGEIERQLDVIVKAHLDMVAEQKQLREDIRRRDVEIREAIQRLQSREPWKAPRGE